MIVTLTLNPAIDQTLVLPRFVAGDTLRVKSSRFDPGGKGINVSRVIKELGGESVAMGFAPGGLGRYVEHTLENQGIECDFTHTKGETRSHHDRRRIAPYAHDSERSRPAHLGEVGR
jgi:1-phosphofructokinase